MTCYFRHLKLIFEKANIIITKENKQDVDKVVHSIVGIDYKNCSATWKEAKKHIIKDEAKFVNTLKSRLTKN